MRRWVLILVLLVLPFQMVWAAAAQYCEHESTPLSQHFGHHEHKHQGGSQTQSLEDAAVARSDHVDCEVCHLASPTSTTQVSMLGIPMLEQPRQEYHLPLYLSRVPNGPERPQRVFDTPAVRFGDGVVTSTSYF